MIDNCFRRGSIALRTALIILIILILGSGAFLAWQFFGGQLPTNRTARPTPSGPVTLNFWGVYDDASRLQPIIDAYRAQNPNVTINYSQKEASLYEFVSLNLLASQEGPDVWMVPLEWLPKHRDKFRPAPEGFLREQANIEAPKASRRNRNQQADETTNAKLYPKLFASVTNAANIANDTVYTLPLAVDTLGLYANPGLLAANGVNGLPTTWEQVVEAAKALTKRSTLTINQPGIALGTSNNVSRSVDILAALLIQNHTPMISEDGTEALYNQAITKSTGEPIQPGPIALDFYTSFASPTKENYSWDTNQPNDFELFSKGQLPLMIDYSYRVQDLKQQSPSLDFRTAGLPQITGTAEPKTLATALMVGVPSVSRNSDAAWDFIQFLTNEQNSLAYSRASGRPPARLSLLQDPASRPELAPFIAQVPIATTWYRNEVNKTDVVFKQAIDAVLAGQPVSDVITKLTKQVTHILRGEDYE